jgi:hypothetical protein
MVGHVGTVSWKQQNRAPAAGGFRIDSDLERFEVEHDQLGRVGGSLWALGDHERHRLAHETHTPLRERGPCKHIRHHLEADAARQAQVGCFEHGDDARRRCRGGDFHRANRGVSQSRPHEGHVKTPVRSDVVDVAAGACDEARILAPADGVTENRARSQSLHWQPEVKPMSACLRDAPHLAT